MALARLVALGSNLLVLDEPTNHLDLWARASLESSLKAFDGTFIFVSHDRYFLNRLANRLLVFGDHVADSLHPRLIEGNYDTYCHLRSAEAAIASEGKQRLTKAKKSGKKKASSEPGKAPRRRFPYRKTEDLEAEIAKKEAEITRLEAALADPETFRNGDRARQAQADYDRTQSDLAQLYEHWEEAVELN